MGKLSDACGSDRGGGSGSGSQLSSHGLEREPGRCLKWYSLKSTTFLTEQTQIHIDFLPLIAL